jgi:hypothetical protein
MDSQNERDFLMEFALRAFILLDGKIKRFGVSRLSRMHNDLMPEYAGQKIPYAILVFEREEGRLGDLRHHECGYLVFDSEGKLDESKGLNHLRLVQAGENDPKSFAARRAEQVRRENTWYPSGDQLSQMIAQAKKRK